MHGLEETARARYHQLRSDHDHVIARNLQQSERFKYITRKFWIFFLDSSERPFLSLVSTIAIGQFKRRFKSRALANRQTQLLNLSLIVHHNPFLSFSPDYTRFYRFRRRFRISVDATATLMEPEYLVSCKWKCVGKGWSFHECWTFLRYCVICE